MADARLTIGRDYCRACKTGSVQRFSGWAAPPEEGKPRAFYRQCDGCGSHRLVLQNVNDAEGLCRTVLKKWLDRSETRASAGAGHATSDGKLDPEDALAYLQGVIWSLYQRWVPAKSDNSFLAYASDLLPRRLAVWSREASGEAETRAGGRKFPKAHATSVSVSLDGLLENAEQDKREGQGGGDRQGQLTSAAGGLGREVDGGLGAFTADHAENRSLDLLRVLAEGDRGGAERHGGEGVAASGRAAA